MSRSLREIGHLLAAAIESGTPVTLSPEDAAAMFHAMTTGEPLSEAPKVEPVELPNGDLENFTIRIAGKLARCPGGCGCNVFHKPDRTRLDLYQCNSCDVRFTGE